MKPKLPVFCLIMSLSAAFFAISAEDDELLKNKEVLAYGLESEIVGLLQKLESDEAQIYYEEILNLFNTTRSTPVKDAIIQYFKSKKNFELKNFALALLSDPMDAKRSTVLAVIDYVAALKITEASLSLHSLVNSGNNEFRDQAIKALGSVGGPDDAAFLLEYLDSEIDADEKTRLIIRQNIMTALGDIGSQDSWSRLSEIASNDNENAYIRASAGVAIGRMGKIESVDILSSMFEESDPLLRSAAIEGLSEFAIPESDSLILEALKDAYYKVRLQAIDAVQKKKLSAAVPYLIYRAENDPEEIVKSKAFEALGILKTDDSVQWLIKYFKDIKRSDKYRVKSAESLLRNEAQIFYQDFIIQLQEILADEKRKSLRNELLKLYVQNTAIHSNKLTFDLLLSKDALLKNAALDVLEKSYIPELHTEIEKLASDEKQGAVSRRAKKILDRLTSKQ